MAGRNHLPPNALKLREAPHPDPRILQAQAHSRAHPLALLENRIAAQQREIQTLLVDNQRLAATHVALKQDLSAAQQDLRHLSAAAASVKAECDARVREVYEKALSLESEVRSIDGLAVELAQVRTDVQKLTAERKELTEKLAVIDDDLVRARSKLQQLPAIKAEIEAMQKEIQRGRAAIEYEKKMYVNNQENSQIMEQNMISMAREIDKLNAELANAEKRAKAAAAAATSIPGFAAGYVNPEPGYGGNLYPDPYAVPQVQGSVGTSLHYGPGTMPHGLHGPYDIPTSHVHR